MLFYDVLVTISSRVLNLCISVSNMEEELSINQKVKAIFFYQIPYFSSNIYDQQACQTKRSISSSPTKRRSIQRIRSINHER